MRRRGRSDRGAALVEFALIAPLLFLLLFGIIEFGWAFSQHLDVRHGAREGGRLAAVNYESGAGSATAQRDAIGAEICSRMDDEDANVPASSVELTKADGPDPGTSTNDPGDKIVIEVRRELDTLTGLLDFALDGVDLRSEVDIRAEQELTWADGTVVCS